MSEELSKKPLPTVRPMFFFLPGLFLLILGMGNLWVGEIKEQEYQTVLDELQMLSTAAPAAKLVHASPLKRVQLALNAAERTFHRREKALARKEFYSLVRYGGRFLTLAGFLFLLSAFAVRSLTKTPVIELEDIL